MSDPSDKYVARLRLIPWAVVGSVLALLISVSSTIFSYQSVKEARRSADIAQQTLDVSQRAYIAMSSVSWRDYGADSPLLAQIRINNTGATPALQLRTTSTILIVTPETLLASVIPRSTPESTPPASQSAVQANGIVDIQTRSQNPVSQDVIRGIEDGYLKLYVLGEFFYTDVFGKRHQTNVCVSYDPQLDIFPSCDQHNELD